MTTFPETRGEDFDLTNLMYQIAIERKKCNLPITAEYLKWLCIEIKKQNTIEALKHEDTKARHKENRQTTRTPTPAQEQAILAGESTLCYV